MSRNRITPWFREATTASPWTGTVLLPADARYVPLHLRDLEAWKSEALWPDPATYAIAYDAMCKQGVALLSDATDRIVSEVRALRDGANTDLLSRDPATDPYTLDLPTLGDIGSALVAPDGRTAAELLLSIEQNLLTGDADAEELLEQVKLIALLLGV